MSITDWIIGGGILVGGALLYKHMKQKQALLGSTTNPLGLAPNPLAPSIPAQIPGAVNAPAPIFAAQPVLVTPILQAQVPVVTPPAPVVPIVPAGPPPIPGDVSPLDQTWGRWSASLIMQAGAIGPGGKTDFTSGPAGKLDHKGWSTDSAIDYAVTEYLKRTSGDDGMSSFVNMIDPLSLNQMQNVVQNRIDLGLVSRNWPGGGADLSTYTKILKLVAYRLANGGYTSGANVAGWPVAAEVAALPQNAILRRHIAR